MATTIQEFAAEREIKFLLHFTRASNLASILDRGLVPRDTLILEGQEAIFNDQFRYDGTHAVCLSIHFPNYKMFWGLRKDHPQHQWVVLAIHPAILWEHDCAFCITNAASATVTAVPLDARRGLAAFQRMFGDYGSIQRQALGIPLHYPTNPQAEVLALSGVPRKYIMGVAVLNTAMQQQVQADHPGVDVRVLWQYFRYRQDFATWKNA
jgi:hypothetical protein